MPRLLAPNPPRHPRVRRLAVRRPGQDPAAGKRREPLPARASQRQRNARPILRPATGDAPHRRPAGRVARGEHRDPRGLTRRAGTSRGGSNVPALRGRTAQRGHHGVHRRGDAVVVAILTRRHRPCPRGGDGDEVRAPLVSGRRAPREFAGSRTAVPPRIASRVVVVVVVVVFRGGSRLGSEGGAQRLRRGPRLRGFPPAADVPRSLEHDVEVGRAHDQHADAAPGPEGPDAPLANLEAARRVAARDVARGVPRGRVIRRGVARGRRRRRVGVGAVGGDQIRRGARILRGAVFFALPYPPFRLPAVLLDLLLDPALDPLCALLFLRLRTSRRIRRPSPVLRVSQRHPPRPPRRRVVPAANRREPDHPHPALGPRRAEHSLQLADGEPREGDAVRAVGGQLQSLAPRRGFLLGDVVED